MEAILQPVRGEVHVLFLSQLSGYLQARQRALSSHLQPTRPKGGRSSNTTSSRYILIQCALINSPSSRGSSSPCLSHPPSACPLTQKISRTKKPTPRQSQN